MERAAPSLDTSTHASIRRKRTPRGMAFRILGWWLVGTLVLAFGAFGGVHAWTRAWLHIALAVAAGLLVATPTGLLPRLGRVAPLCRRPCGSWPASG